MSSSDSQESGRSEFRGRIRVAVRSADERTQRRLRREAVRRAGITLARTRTLRRVAERIAEDPSFSVGAQQTAAEVLRHSLEEGDKESHWTALSTIENGSDRDDTSSRWIAQQVAEEALRPTQPGTPEAGDLEEEFGNSEPAPASTASAPSSPAQTPASGSIVLFEDDTMPYPYPKYSNHPDARAHVKQSRFIWAVNYRINSRFFAPVPSSAGSAGHTANGGHPEATVPKGS